MVIRFLTQLADIAGTKALEVKLDEDGIVMKDLLNRIGKLNKKAAEAVLSGSELAEDVYVLINGRHISSLNGLDSLVADNDEITFVPVTEAG